MQLLKKTQTNTTYKTYFPKQVIKKLQKWGLGPNNLKIMAH